MQVGASRELPAPGRRILAAIIDLTVMASLITVGTLFLWMVATGGPGGGSRPNDLALLAIVVSLLAWIVAVLAFYAPLLMCRRGKANGQTIGKQLMGLKVVTEDSSPMTFLRAVRREALGKGPFIIASVMLMPLAIPLIAADFAWGKLRRGERRTLHDRIGRTYVLTVNAHRPDTR